MRYVARYAILVALAVSSVLGGGCGKKNVAVSPVSPSAPKLPGTDEVAAAMEKKDYDTAMLALLKAKAAVTTSEENVQYSMLARDVRAKLAAAAPNDPKAAEAFAALRDMTMGR